jgi:hypothetical protein
MFWKQRESTFVKNKVKCPRAQPLGNSLRFVGTCLCVFVESGWHNRQPPYPGGTAAAFRAFREVQRAISSDWGGEIDVNKVLAMLTFINPRI